MYTKNTHFHFVGIGGIGMSGIAKVLVQRGYRVSGCDKNINQKSIRGLQELGCLISEEHNSPLCQNDSITYMVYSTDVPSHNPEFEYARFRGIPIVHRATVLAELTKQAYTLGVAGSHGKTTTSSLISHILLEAQLDPTVIVGGYIQNIGSNAHNGTGTFLVAETDESDRSLVQLFPTIAVLTNIDLEHMNTYQNLQDVIQTFEAYLKKLPFYGTAIVCYDDPHIRTLLPLKQTQTVTYGITTESQQHADVTIKNLSLYPTYSTYELVTKMGTALPVTLSIPGEHNVCNSLAALAAARQIGVSLQQAISSLATFGGVERRFTYKGKFKNIEVFDDYGHHPTEITCTLKNAYRYANGRPLTLVFQPHRYTRTHLLWNEFVKLLSTTPANTVIVTDIYAAHEPNIDGISSTHLVEAVKKVRPDCNIHYVPYEQNYHALQSYIKAQADKEGVVLIQGAGPITGFAQSLVE